MGDGSAPAGPITVQALYHLRSWLCWTLAAAIPAAKVFLAPRLEKVIPAPACSSCLGHASCDLAFLI